MSGTLRGLLDALLSATPSPTPSPQPGASGDDGSTSILSIIGAAGGLIGTATGLYAVSNSYWARRGKDDDLLRGPLEELRDVLAAIQQQSVSVTQLGSARNQSLVQGLQDVQPRVSDRRLRRRLASVRAKVAVATTTPSPATGGQGAAAAGKSIKEACEAVTAAIDRLDKLRRRAPS